MTVNGNPNWEFRLATSLSQLSTSAVIVSSPGRWKTLTKPLSLNSASTPKVEEIEKEKEKKE